MGTSIRFRLIAGSLILFITAFGINVILNSSSVDKLCEESTIAKYRVIGENLHRRLSGLLIFDQRVDGVDGIDNIEHLFATTKAALLKRKSDDRGSSGSIQSVSTALFSVSLVLPDGRIAYSTDQNDLAKQVSESVLKNFKYDASNEFYHSRHDEIYCLNFPITGVQKDLLASLVVTIPANIVQVHKNILIREKFTSLMWILCSGIFLLVLSLILIIDSTVDNQTFSKTRISLMLFFVICGAQIAFSGLTTLTFTDLYLIMNKEKTRMRVGLMKEQFESFLKEDDNIKNLAQGEVMLSDIIAESPELNDITLFDEKWHPLFIVTKTKALNCQSATLVQINKMKRSLPDWEPKYNVRLVISKDDQIKGYISTNISKKILYNRLVEIGLDSLTVLVISILFLVEMIILIFNFFERDSGKKQPPYVEQSSTQPPVHYGLMRPAAFLLLFGYDISMSFLPLHTEKLYAPLFGLSKDVIMGLPISVELFFVGVCILVAGVWLDKRGWHEPFLVGLFLAGAGILYSWGAPNVFNFILSRAITGSGYGLALMASQGFVIEYSDSKSKARGLAYLFAGIYAGSLCGSATGAMLADRFTYSSVFFAGSLILFSVIVYTLLFMRNGMKKPQSQMKRTQQDSVPVKTVTQFLTNRIVIALVFFSSLPAAIAVVGFLNYFSPIYLNRMGASQSTIGRILMIYGVCLIYIGPLISKYVDASHKKRLYIFMGCVLGSLAFLTFNVIEGVIAAAIAVFLLGLSSSFVLASQSAYTLRLKVTEQLGAGKSIGIFRSTSRGGQVLGPIVFSSLILATNIEVGITYFGLAYFAFAIIFLLLTVKDKPLLSF